MITEHDLQEAIAECQGERHPNASTCLKLASFLTIQREMFRPTEVPSYSYAPPPIETYESDTEFGQVIAQTDLQKVLPIIDELMTTIKIVKPRLYAGVLDKLAQL